MRNPHRSKRKDYKNNVHYITKSMFSEVVKFKKPTTLQINRADNCHIFNCTFINVKQVISHHCGKVYVQDCVFGMRNYKEENIKDGNYESHGLKLFKAAGNGINDDTETIQKYINN